MQIGKLIKTLREEQGITLRDLGQKVGCGHSNLVAIQRGRSKPSYELLEALAGALGVTWEIGEDGAAVSDD